MRLHDNRVLELYSYACTSGEQNAAISYIILHLTYILGPTIVAAILER